MASSLAQNVDPQRVRDLQGVLNFRDLGGYATSDGRRVRWGRIYRSAKLSKATATGLNSLDDLAMASVVDFRTAEERTAEPTRWLRRPEHVYESPKPTIRPLMDQMLSHAVDETTAYETMKLLYTQIPELYREEFSVLFKQLAQGGMPLLLHCTAGKDRTGIACALILTALGVPRDRVVEDYELTEKLQDAGRQAALHEAIAGPPSMGNELAAKPRAVQVALWRARQEFLDAGFASIEQRYGSIEAYLQQGLGLDPSDLQALRQHLLE